MIITIATYTSSASMVSQKINWLEIKTTC